MSRFMSMIAVFTSGFLLLAGAAARAETVTVEEAFDGADSVCGRGWTAIQRLPAVRIVVFDPVSNSFGFVACPRDGAADEKEKEAQANLDFLDRRRLALPTQKIRLLILPYNPADGNLTLEKIDGDGIETEEISGASLPDRQAAAALKGAQNEKGKEVAPEDKPEKPEISSPAVRTKVLSARRKSGVRLEKEDTAAQYRDYFEDEGLDDEGDAYFALAALADIADEYLRIEGRVSGDLRGVESDLRCLKSRVAALPLEFSRELSMVEGRPFSMERDLTLAELRQEAGRRVRLISKDLYEPCLAEKDASFADDIRAFELNTTKLSAGLALLRRTSSDMLPYLRTLDVSGDTQAYFDSYEDFVSDAVAFNDGLDSKIQELEAAGEKLQEGHAGFQRALSSPALQMQRFNYNPLPNGKAVTFVIRRGAKLPDDGDAIPARVNRLEIKSAPAYNLRFGTGLVATRLKNPTYKVAEFPQEEEAESEKRLVFDKESDGGVLPGLFLNHYWGKKSPLLQRTPLEMWLPTLSLGIPVSEASLFTQLFVGLRWELTTGFDVNVGYHFGKVNALADLPGVRVGDPLPAGVDTQSIQKETFDSAVYFGIVVTRDAFDRVFGNGEN